MLGKFDLLQFGSIQFQFDRLRDVLDFLDHPADFAVAERDQRLMMRRKDFPPLLCTLNGNGRPRFAMKKVRSDGRLLIFVENN